MSKLTELPSWQALGQHYDAMQDHKLTDLFAEQPDRFSRYSMEAAGLFLDYSKNHITDQTLAKLAQLAKDVNLEQHIDDLFRGQPVNHSENCPALHTALRNQSNEPVYVDGVNVMDDIKQVQTQMAEFVDAIRTGRWSGYSGQKITDVVNIGIGGSDLGPQMVTKALLPYENDLLRCHFVANIDGADIFEILKNCHPETTLFIVSSKSFTTQETLHNANAAKEWLINAAGNAKAVSSHFVAITAKPENAINYGIPADNIFRIWDWVGGRFSLWSAMGLIIALTIGMDNFIALQKGAFAMDEHFHFASPEKNMPITLALIGIWYRNFFDAQSTAILPYSHYLRILPSHLQQLFMESNGKSCSQDGDPLDYTTAPITWGGEETNGQHAFHQLLLQGTALVPVDFIVPLTSHNPIGQHHQVLFANCLAQSRALMCGNPESERNKNKIIPGNRPSNTIIMPKLTPYALGALIALYEHKTYVQSVIWQTNAFDQWGVNLGKTFATQISQDLELKKPKNKYDQSTQGLINYYQKTKVNNEKLVAG